MQFNLIIVYLYVVAGYIGITMCAKLIPLGCASQQPLRTDYQLMTLLCDQLSIMCSCVLHFCRNVQFYSTGTFTNVFMVLSILSWEATVNRQPFKTWLVQDSRLLTKVNGISQLQHLPNGKQVVMVVAVKPSCLKSRSVDLLVIILQYLVESVLVQHCLLLIYLY